MASVIPDCYGRDVCLGGHGVMEMRIQWDGWSPQGWTLFFFVLLLAVQQEQVILSTVMTDSSVFGTHARRWYCATSERFPVAYSQLPVLIPSREAQMYWEVPLLRVLPSDLHMVRGGRDSQSVLLCL